MKIPVFKDISEAYNRIKPFIHNTPVLTCNGIDQIAGAQLFFKCENFQKAGAFKFRGATNSVQSLSEDLLKKGVATHSSGNHAAALALAAKQRNTKAYIVMPENAPQIKIDAVRSYGGEITFCKPTLEARELTLKKIVEQTGATEIHPYKRFEVICGQGTATLEFFEQVKDLDVLMTPVGGGGLLSGTAIASKHISPSTKVIAAEPKNADDAYRSFKSGQLVPSINPKTIADGLLTSLGELNFSIIQKYVDDILTVKEKSILAVMKLVWERMKIVIEPSSAVPLAAVLENKQLFKDKRVGIILSGGNVAFPAG